LNFLSGCKDDNHTTASHVQNEIDDYLCTPQIGRKCGILMMNFAGGDDDGEVGNHLPVAAIQSSNRGVKIGDQTWQAMNLDVDTYRNGDPIPLVTSPAVWETLSTGAYCYYDNSPGTDRHGNDWYYGKLYNWYAVNDPRGLAPTGWHVPSDSEWNELINYLGGDAVAGGKLKEAGTTRWDSPNTGATNSSGFQARPGGMREGTCGCGFSLKNEDGLWWSSSEDPPFTDSRSVGTDYYWGIIIHGGTWRASGLSVRCVKD
jgi:uncharacterized protein (TIGR02145 family)